MPRSTSNNTSSQSRVSVAGGNPVTDSLSSAAGTALRIEWKEFIDEGLRATLQNLFRLNAYAKQNRMSLNHFAVPMSDFQLWGHSEMQLRVLVMEGVLLHLRETTVHTSRSRQFEKGGLHSFGKTSCFLLSDTQDETLGGLLASNEIEYRGHAATPALDLASTLPIWDPRKRKLMFYGMLVKHFRCPAHNQETILSAFQEEEWLPRISDPLPPISSSDSKQRLHDTIRSLNRNQANPLIKFGGDGTGEGIVWEVQKPSTRLPTS
jgi:hypothetical protein